MSDRLAHLLPTFLPSALLREVSATASVDARHWCDHGAALSIDISGFSALAEALGASGAFGAEQLAARLSEVFDPIIECIHEHHGEIEQFAGDNVLASWSGDEHTLVTHVSSAFACAQHIQRSWSADQAERPLRVRMGVGVGELRRAILGGVDGRFKYLIGGTAVHLAQVAEAGAPVGGVELAAAVAALFAQGTQILVSSTPTDVYAATPRATRQVPAFPIATRALLARMVPRSIRDLDASDSEWLAEFRRVQVLFADLGPDGLAAGDPQTFIATVAAAQAIVYAMGGSILQLAFEHGRDVLLAAWGVSNANFENDAERALHAAVNLSAMLKQAGRGGGVGVSRGRVFCGLRGNAARREYAVIGSAVNLAARLMQHAPGHVACDKHTRHAAENGSAFEALEPIMLRGFSAAVEWYRPHLAAQANDHALLEREAELARITRALDALLRNAKSSAVGDSAAAAVMGFIIEGEPGIGKSRLLEAAHAATKERGARCLQGAGVAIHRNLAYHPWRPLLENFAGLAGHANSAARKAAFTELLSALPDGAARAPLLADIVGFDVEPTRVTRELTGRARIEATSTLIVELLAAACQQAPLVLSLEDLHWFDSASLSVVTAVLRARLRVLVLITHRPLLDDTAPTPDDAFTHLELMSLKQLGPANAAILIAHTLGVEQVPQVVTEWVIGKAAGHPFFIEELVRSLRELGHITVQGSVCSVSGEPHQFGLRGFPESLEGVITSRIDALTAQQRLMLRVASVIGRRFSVAALREMPALAKLHEDLPAELAALSAKGLLDHESQREGGMWVFHHALVGEFVYEGLLFAQRRTLHRGVAEWLQRRSGERAVEPALLAHHWFAAGDVMEGAHHGSVAGAQALQAGAYREAVGFYSRLLDLLQAEEAQVQARFEDELIAEWQAGLGEARFALGDFRGATPNFLEALTLLGVAAPRTTQAWARVLISDLFRQLGYRLWAPRGTRSVLRFAALAAVRLSERAYFERRPIMMVAACLMATNLSARAGPGGHLARAYSMLSVILRVAGIGVLADLYNGLALRMGRRVGDLGAEVFAGFTHSTALTGCARFGEASTAASAALTLARSLGNQEDTEMCLCAVGNVAFYQGQFAAADGCFEEVAKSAAARSNSLHEAWGLYAVARGALARGNFGPAEAPLRRALELLARHSEEVSEVICHGLLAELLFGTQRRREAEQEALTALELIRNGPPTVITERDGYAGAAGVLLALWERAVVETGRVSPRLRSSAIEAERAMARFARVFPIGRPRALLLSGRRLWLQNQPRKALALWRRGLHLAERLAMPSEAALLHRELGWRDGHGRQQWHRQQAQQLCAQLGCDLTGSTAPPAAMVAVNV